MKNMMLIHTKTQSFFHKMSGDQETNKEDRMECEIGLEEEGENCELNQNQNEEKDEMIIPNEAKKEFQQLKDKPLTW